MAFQIVRHAFSMIFANLGQALRVSIGPYLILIFGVVIVFMLIGDRFDYLDQAPSVEMLAESGGVIVILAGLAILLLVLFIFGWIAVSWHRFILLEEYSGVLPAVADRPIWPYIGRSILYGLLMVVIAVPLFTILGLIASPFFSAGFPVGGFIVFLITAAILAFIWFRIALALPSVAVGKPITIGEAWAASSGLSGTIFGVAFLLMLINGIADLVVGQIASLMPIVGFVLDVGIQWLLLMLGTSILTTLYGHLIEKRPLIG